MWLKNLLTAFFIFVKIAHIKSDDEEWSGSETHFREPMVGANRYVKLLSSPF